MPFQGMPLRDNGAGTGTWDIGTGTGTLGPGPGHGTLGPGPGHGTGTWDIGTGAGTLEFSLKNVSALAAIGRRFESFRPY